MLFQWSVLDQCLIGVGLRENGVRGNIDSSFKEFCSRGEQKSLSNKWRSQLKPLPFYHTCFYFSTLSSNFCPHQIHFSYNTQYFANSIFVVNEKKNKWRSRGAED